MDLRPATDTADAAAETIAQLLILRVLLRVSLHDQLAPASTQGHEAASRNVPLGRRSSCLA